MSCGNGRMNRQNDDMPRQHVPERKSKSQIKRDMKVLQKVGERLVDLSPNQLERITLPDELREAIRFATTLKKREAWRRHVKHIGALMRDMDIGPIIAALEDIEQGQRREARKLHRIEKWRDELIHGNTDRIKDILNQFSEADRQRLMQLGRNARKEEQLNKPPKASRVLFRCLRKLDNGRKTEIDDC